MSRMRGSAFSADLRAASFSSSDASDVETSPGYPEKTQTRIGRVRQERVENVQRVEVRGLDHPRDA
jgi:hypothetical protein